MAINNRTSTHRFEEALLSRVRILCPTNFHFFFFRAHIDTFTFKVRHNLTIYVCAPSGVHPRDSDLLHRTYYCTHARVLIVSPFYFGRRTRHVLQF